MSVQKRGVMLCLEGVDGCGKTTQAKRLWERLTKFGLDVLLVREPGTTSVGQRVREILMDRGMQMSREAEAMLFMASRIELIVKQTGPALAAGKVVIYDRFIESTLGYQVHAGGSADLGYEDAVVAILERYAGYGWYRQAVVFNVPPAVARARRADDNRMEDNLRDVNFEKALHEFYASDVDFTFSDPERALGWSERATVHVDGSADPDEVHRKVLAGVESVLRDAGQWPRLAG